MAMLGEMLLKVGALTEAQLEQVLKAQAIYGGRLGTNLVEMGLLGEDELARVLNEKCGVPCIEQAALNSIPQEVLDVVPQEMVERYRVLPVAISGKKLTLAMADPSDFGAIDEIGFVTGLVIVPRVCSELRLSMALERYFGIKRTLRYIPVEGGSRSRFAGAAGEKWQAAAGECAAPGNEHLPPHVSIQALAESFSRASGMSEVVDELMSYLAGEFDRGAFLSLRDGVVVGVKAVAEGRGIDAFASFAAVADQSPLLMRVVEERRFFLGEIPADGVEGRLLKAMESPAPSPGLIHPLSVEDQVAALICVTDLKGRLAGGAFELQRVGAMAELTFEMLCTRKRIRSC